MKASAHAVLGTRSHGKRTAIPVSGKVQTVLAELRRRLEQLYGVRLVKLVLFGSQARGDAAPDSDIDVLVVLRGPVEPSREIHRASPVTASVSLDNDVVISCVYVSEERYNADRGPLLLNVRADGVPV
jgi:predicted nucleotidyltransferase